MVKRKKTIVSKPVAIRRFGEIKRGYAAAEGNGKENARR